MFGNRTYGGLPLCFPGRPGALQKEARLEIWRAARRLFGGSDRPKAVVFLLVSPLKPSKKGVVCFFFSGNPLTWCLSFGFSFKTISKESFLFGDPLKMVAFLMVSLSNQPEG